MLYKPGAMVNHRYVCICAILFVCVYKLAVYTLSFFIHRVYVCNYELSVFAPYPAMRFAVDRYRSRGLVFRGTAKTAKEIVAVLAVINSLRSCGHRGYRDSRGAVFAVHSTYREDRVAVVAVNAKTARP